MINNSKLKKYFSQQEAPAILLLLLVALSAPFFLLPLERWLNYDIIVEEVGKLLILLIASYFILNKSVFLVSAIIFGLFFAWMENILYLNNFFLAGATSGFWERCLLTSFLHTATAIIVAGIICKRRYLFPVALFLNIILHYAFNSSF